MGGTTSQSHRKEDEDMEFNERTGKMFNVKPMPLFIIRSKGDQELEKGENAEGEESKAEEGSENKGAEESGKDKPAEEGKKPD